MKQFSVRVSDERYAAFAAEAKEKEISLSVLANLYFDQPLGENKQETVSDIHLLLELVRKIDRRTEKMSKDVIHFPNESEPIERTKSHGDTSQEPNVKSRENAPKDLSYEDINKNQQKLAAKIVAASAARRNLPAPLALIDVLGKEKEPEEPPLNSWDISPSPRFYDDPNFDESMFALMGPQDRRGQVINYNFCRDTIRWNERIFTGEHEIKPISWDTPKDINHEIAINGEQEWQAAISHMPANNDITSISLMRMQWKFSGLLS